MSVVIKEVKMSFWVRETFRKLGKATTEVTEQLANSGMDKISFPRGFMCHFSQKLIDFQEQFTTLKKRRGKFECLVYEILLRKEKRPTSYI